MTIDLTIRNGKVFTPEGFQEGGVSIEGERIIKIGKDPHLLKASTTINAQGAMIIPGLIDLHVHLRDLKQQYKETMETGSRAAANGGVTTVFDMPNNKPPTNTAQRIITKRKIISGKAAANIGFYGLVPEKVEHVQPLAREGIFGFKIYPASPIYPPKNPQKLFLFAKEIAKTKLPLMVHPDTGYAAAKEKELFEKEMPKIEAFLKAHNQIDEAQAVKDFADLTEKVKGKLHCVHLTADEAISAYEKVKSAEITAEVCPHHLLLSTKTLHKEGAKAKCLPPLRTKKDQQSLWKAIDSGVIEIIATDHAPHSFKEKHTDFEEAAAGIHGLETFLPVMFTAALKGKVELTKLVQMVTRNPASFAGLKDRGTLREGAYADIVLVKKEKGKIDAETFESKAKWTPFDGQEVLVKSWYVIVNGFLAKEDDYLLSKTRSGKILKKPTEFQNEREGQ